jgi:hypothetical protein
VDERDLIENITAMRIRWRDARERKLSRKREIMALGRDVDTVRHDRLYRGYQKEQRSFFRRIRHLEKKLNRKKAGHEDRG